MRAYTCIGDPIFPVDPLRLWLLQGQRQRLGEGNLLDLHKQREAARRKAREEKARQARQAAIQVPGTPEPTGAQCWGGTMGLGHLGWGG